MSEQDEVADPNIPGDRQKKTCLSSLKVLIISIFVSYPPVSKYDLRFTYCLNTTIRGRLMNAESTYFVKPA
jgi:hypothetical protein